MKKHIPVIVFVIVLLTAVYVVGNHRSNTKPAVVQKQSTSTNKTTKSNTTTKPTEAKFNASAHSISDPASIWVVVNKHRQLNPSSYIPAELVVPNVPLRSNITSTEQYVRRDMATALESLVAAAKSENINLNLQSGYRSYTFQVSLYNSYVASDGQVAADRYSARPGYSEHQTGLAADIGGMTNPSCNVAECYADTVEGKWLAANAWKYGFIIRYPADKEPITGYQYEPWHVRYVGVDLSTEMHKTGVETLEEFFGLGAAPTYQ